MFKIQDGRKCFYQWDLNRKIVLEDKAIPQVHFSNAFGNNAFVVLAQDGVAEVPNILLQEDADILVYAYDGEATKHTASFGVVKRNKPDGYVYTETEVLNYTQLMEKLDKIDANMGEYVQDYLKENPPEVDLTGYAKSEEIPSKVSQLENDQKFVDQDTLVEYLDALSEALEDQIPDMSAYAKKSEIPSVEGLATESYVDAEIAKAQLAGKDVDLTDYATKDYVNKAVAAIPQPDMTDYYTKSEVVELIPDTSGFALSSEIPDVSAYQTAAQVEAAINSALGAIGVAERGAY